MATLEWRDSKDAYKPIQRPLLDFLRETQHRIVEPSYRNIESLYRQLSVQEMSVFVQQEAVDQLIHHLSVDPYNETGGVLVGHGYWCPERRIHYTEIVGSIPASYTIGNRVHFQFTRECWQEIFQTQKQDFPSTTIVGWYHSHPGHGIFLSGTDLNTQRLSFKQIWQIAVVYDSLRHDIGFFYGADGQRISPISLQGTPRNYRTQQDSSMVSVTQTQNNSTPETNRPQEATGQIQPVQDNENYSGIDEANPEISSNNDEINLLTAFNNFFTGFKEIFVALITLFKALAKVIISLAIVIWKMIIELIKLPTKLFRIFFNFSSNTSNRR
ncbi:Mov34/MPN/PAD-1 family protein [Microcoleus sp.]|uniref:Mov34/MPN/PAD-1 family protein n=1 Tax=Microcoleus sp. TaxID=44472 RepID=UPI0035247504